MYVGQRVARVYLDIGRQGGHSELEAHLVVPLAGGAVADERGVVVERRLHDSCPDRQSVGQFMDWTVQ